MQTLFNTDKADTIATAYYMGGRVDAVDSEHGFFAVELIAERLGVSMDFLSLLSRFYRAFDPQFIETCKTRTTDRGNLITLRHLLALADVDSAEFRLELVEEFNAQDLPLEALREFILADSVVFRYPQPPGPEPKPKEPILVAKELIRDMEKSAHRIRVWDLRLVNKVKRGCPTKMYPILLHRLQEAAKGVSTTRDLLESLDINLNDAFKYVEMNIRGPQEPDPRDEWYPKPTA